MQAIETLKGHSMKYLKTMAWALVSGVAACSLASDGRVHQVKAAVAAPEQKAWGIAGNGRSATRTVEITMTDNMRFTPAHIEVRQGEVLRFVLINKGRMMHEMVLGTQQELDRHAAQMLKFPGMEHDEPHMKHVSAGRRGVLAWNFNRAGEFAFACLIPGHYQAGMRGTITVRAAP
ncbi:MAG: cupredoxin family protein [Burkholderiaceae bacterium]|nr:cupredoxin family protein [Burkholderiaceae bacterium]